MTTAVDRSVSPPLRARLTAVACVLGAGLVILLLAEPVPTARADPEAVFPCGRLVVPHGDGAVVVDRYVGAGVPCDDARAVVTDAVLGRDVGARRGFSCQVIPPSTFDGHRYPGSGDCGGWGGGSVSWSLR